MYIPLVVAHTQERTRLPALRNVLIAGLLGNVLVNAVLALGGKPLQVRGPALPKSIYPLAVTSVPLAAAALGVVHRVNTPVAVVPVPALVPPIGGQP